MVEGVKGNHLKCHWHCEFFFIGLVLYFFPWHTSNSWSVLSPQVTKGMFGARKKFVEFVEVVDNDFTDESMYYNQPSMFPHRSDKDVSSVPITELVFLVNHRRDIFDLTPSCLHIFRCCPRPRHRRQVSCRSLVQVCMVHKVSICSFIY